MLSSLQGGQLSGGQPNSVGGTPRVSSRVQFTTLTQPLLCCCQAMNDFCCPPTAPSSSSSFYHPQDKATVSLARLGFAPHHFASAAAAPPALSLCHLNGRQRQLKTICASSHRRRIRRRLLVSRECLHCVSRTDTGERKAHCSWNKKRLDLDHDVDDDDDDDDDVEEE